MSSAPSHHGIDQTPQLRASLARLANSISRLRVTNDRLGNQAAREGGYTSPQKARYNQR